MKKTVLLVTLLVFAVGIFVTASFSAPLAEKVPDVTGYYEGSNTRFLPDKLEVITQQARFHISDQDGKHFWGSVDYYDPGNPPSVPGKWISSGYINGVILPDNTMYFVNYNANYDIYPGVVSRDASAITYAKFSKSGQKKFETVTIRPVSGNVTSTGIYTDSAGWVE